MARDSVATWRPECMRSLVAGVSPTEVYFHFETHIHSLFQTGGGLLYVL